MTKKDYELIARVFSGTRPNDPKMWAVKSQWLFDVNAMAQAIANTNPKFDRERFVRACEA